VCHYSGDRIAKELEEAQSFEKQRRACLYCALQSVGKNSEAVL
jgi:hypothetical protein